jgi:hypothetical protein
VLAKLVGDDSLDAEVLGGARSFSSSAATVGLAA